MSSCTRGDARVETPRLAQLLGRQVGAERARAALVQGAGDLAGPQPRSQTAPPVSRIWAAKRSSWARSKGVCASSAAKRAA